MTIDRPPRDDDDDKETRIDLGYGDDPDAAADFSRAKWYYNIELPTGEGRTVVTPGGAFLSQPVVRRLLRGVDVAGATCLDVGTMEGVYALLMERRGAARVVAYDRRPQERKVDLVRRALGADFEYLTGMELRDVRDAADRAGRFPFDVVVCGGLLYHAFDPLQALCYLRGLVRDGGILVLETAATLTDEPTLHFNAGGGIYPAPTNFWFPSAKCLDYLLRFVRLRAVDVAFIFEDWNRAAVHRTARLGVTCRAEPDWLPTPGDAWMPDQSRYDSERSFADCLDWASLRTSRPPVGHAMQAASPAWHPEIGCVDVHGSLMTEMAIP